MIMATTDEGARSAGGFKAGPNSGRSPRCPARTSGAVPPMPPGVAMVLSLIADQDYSASYLHPTFGSGSAPATASTLKMWFRPAALADGGVGIFFSCNNNGRKISRRQWRNPGCPAIHAHRQHYSIPPSAPQSKGQSLPKTSGAKITKLVDGQNRASKDGITMANYPSNGPSHAPLGFVGYQPPIRAELKMAEAVVVFSWQTSVEGILRLLNNRVRNFSRTVEATA